MTDNFIAGGVATVFSDGTGLGVTDVELSGLTISGGITGGTIDVEDTGSGTPFGVRDPYLGVGYQICVYGLYPARGT